MVELRPQRAEPTATTRQIGQAGNATAFGSEWRRTGAVYPHSSPSQSGRGPLTIGSSRSSCRMTRRPERSGRRCATRQGSAERHCDNTRHGENSCSTRQCSAKSRFPARPRVSRRRSREVGTGVDQPGHSVGRADPRYARKNKRRARDTTHLTTVQSRTPLSHPKFEHHVLIPDQSGSNRHGLGKGLFSRRQTLGQQSPRWVKGGQFEQSGRERHGTNLARLPRAAVGDGECTTKCHGRDQPKVAPALEDDGPVSRHCRQLQQTLTQFAESIRTGGKQPRGTAASSEQLEMFMYRGYSRLLGVRFHAGRFRRRFK